jgi:hypothetical protein
MTEAYRFFYSYLVQALTWFSPHQFPSAPRMPYREADESTRNEGNRYIRRRSLDLDVDPFSYCQGFEGQMKQRTRSDNLTPQGKCLFGTRNPSI